MDRAGVISEQWQERLQRYSPRLVPQAPRRASVMVLLAETEQGPELLLTQRSLHLETHPGEVSLPGGSVELTDASLYHTALRETQEEAGLRQAPRYLGQLDSLYARSGIEVSAFVSLLPERPELEACPEEVAALFWIPVAELLEKPPEYKWFERNGRQWRVPFFYYQGWTIWGMTGMILVNFVNVIQHSQWPGFHEEWTANPMDGD